MKKIDWTFWLIAVAVLLWNSLGALDYVLTQTENEAYLAQFTPEQVELFYALPLWVVVTWAVAVWGSVLGSVLLLMRHRLATVAFAVALAGILLTSIHTFLLSDALAAMDTAVQVFMSVAVIFIGIGLVFYSRHLGQRGVLT